MCIRDRSRYAARGTPTPLKSAALCFGGLCCSCRALPHNAGSGTVITGGRTARRLCEWFDVGSGASRGCLVFMGCVLREPLLHCRTDCLADLWVLGYQHRELAPIDHVDDDVALGHDGRYALPIVEERNFAEEVAGTARGHDLIVNKHIDSSFQNDDELTSPSSLASQLRPL